MATKTLNIALDEKLLKDVDVAARQDMASRSEYFRRLALTDLNRRRRWADVLDRGNAKGRSRGIASEVQVYRALNKKDA
ncbi:MAG: hypothetical protein AAB932_01690 [Patescibacteria group bacterium]